MFLQQNLTLKNLILEKLFKILGKDLKEDDDYEQLMTKKKITRKQQKLITKKNLK